MSSGFPLEVKIFNSPSTQIPGLLPSTTGTGIEMVEAGTSCAVWLWAAERQKNRAEMAPARVTTYVDARRLQTITPFTVLTGILRSERLCNTSATKKLWSNG